MDYDVLRDYKWCLNVEGDAFFDNLPSLRVKAYKIEGNQQLHYYRQILGDSGTSLGGLIGSAAVEAGGLAVTTAATATTIAVARDVTGIYSKPSSKEMWEAREGAYQSLYNLTDISTTLTVPYFADSAIAFNSVFSEKVGAAESLVGDAIKAAAKISGSVAKTSGKLAADYALGKMPGISEKAAAVASFAVSKTVGSLGIGSIDELTRKIIQTKAGATAAYSGVEQPMYYDSTNKPTINIVFPLYNIFDAQSTINNCSLIQKIAYWSLKNRISAYAYEAPYVFRVEDTSDATAFYTRPLTYISNYEVKNIGTLRKVNLNGYTYTVPEAYVVSISFAEMISPSRNILEAKWNYNNVIKVETRSQVDRRRQEDLQRGQNTVAPTFLPSMPFYAPNLNGR